MVLNQRLKLSLFLLRMNIFIVMLFWTVDKFVRPEHVAAVFEHFYFIDDVSAILMKSIGAMELILVACFLLGIRKQITYGSVLILHGISTLSSYNKYLAAFDKVNLLFFAAWPMLAACISLYLLRDEDTLFTIG